MRIARAEVIHLHQDEAYGALAGGGESHGVQNLCLVRLETDDGIVGWADVETQPSIARAVMDAPAQFAFSGLRHVIVGRDPWDVDALWDDMYRASIYYGRRGVAIHVMSGIVNACFDIVGKATGQPLSALLGGRRRDRVRAYASTLFRDEPAPDGGRRSAATARRASRRSSSAGASSATISGGTWSWWPPPARRPGPTSS